MVSMAEIPVEIISSGYTYCALAGLVMGGPVSQTLEYGLIGLPLISKNSSARTLGPLSIARPDPSKIRPSMSSDTPSFKLSPVNSTRVCSKSAWRPIAQDRHSPHLLYIDTGCAFEDLCVCRKRVSDRATIKFGFGLYLDDRAISWSSMSVILQDKGERGKIRRLPRASKT